MPVPALESLVPTAPGELPPHVTILYPFIGGRCVDEAVLSALAEVLGPVTAFPFRLTAIGHFPGVTYLRPEPAGPFVAMTSSLVARWPDHPPYDGAYSEVVPHLTVTEHAARALGNELPISAVAREVHVATQDRQGRWHTRSSFPLAS